MLTELNPGFLMMAGALLVPVLPANLRGAYAVGLSVVVFALIVSLTPGAYGTFELFDFTLTSLRVDRLSLIFAYIFSVAAILGMLYAFHLKDWLQPTMALIYAGAAIAAVFAGDFITLFIGWEITAISSVFLIWAAGTRAGQAAGMRYLIVQVGSGVILLAGILIYAHQTGSIAFNAVSPDDIGGQLILLGIGIKCAFPFLHNWLQDAYPEATITGTVILSAFTTKLAVYALARGFAGTEILIPIGCIMALFPLAYAIVEDDLRRVLAYLLNNQLGFMVVGVGVGTELALNGVGVHAVSHVLYKALLFMSIGAVLYRTGTAKASELGGLWSAMPFTAIITIVATAAMSAPLFAGFVTKSLIISGTAADGHFWAWIVLLLATQGAVFAGLRIIYVTFLAPPAARSTARPIGPELPVNMPAAMIITALACLVVGLIPSTIYSLGPFPVDYKVYKFGYVITQLQALAVTGLAFALAVRHGLLPEPRAARLLDTDWFFRRIAHDTGSTVLLLAGDSIRSAAHQGSNLFHAIERKIHVHYNPEGLLGRTWPTGWMAFWATLMLGAYLLVFYFR